MLFAEGKLGLAPISSEVGNSQLLSRFGFVVEEGTGGENSGSPDRLVAEVACDTEEVLRDSGGVDVA